LEDQWLWLEYSILGDDVPEFRFELGGERHAAKTKHVQAEVQQGLMSKLRSKLTSKKHMLRLWDRRTSFFFFFLEKKNGNDGRVGRGESRRGSGGGDRGSRERLIMGR
jgi:hypothetical protein